MTLALDLLIVASLSLAAADEADAKGADPARGAVFDHLRARRFAEAEKAARDLHAREVRERGPGSIESAAAIDVLMRVLWEAGKAHTAEALRLAREALSIKETTLQPDDPAVAASLNQLGSLLDYAGDLEGARSRHERALEIRRKAFGPADLRVATSLNNLAWTLKNLGEYPSAKRHFEEAIAIWREKDGHSSDKVAAGLDNLAQLLHHMGDHEGARPRFEEAIAIYEKNHGAKSPFAAVTLNNLARLLHDKGDLEGARQALDRALAIWRDVSEPNPRELASALNNSGWLFRDLGRRDEARESLDRALKLRETHLGSEHPETVWTVRNLGLVALARGEMAKARELLERAARGRREALGPGHPLLAQDLADLAKLHAESGETTKAIETALDAEAIAREHARSTARDLPERLALSYAATRASGLDMALSLAAQGLPAEPRRTVWDALVRSRALVLDEIGARHTAARPAGDPETRRLWTGLTSARRRLANLLVRGPGGEPPERYRALLDAARAEREGAEEALAARSRAFRAEAERARVGLAEAIQALPPRSALAAFARHGGPTGSYLAFVGRSESNEVDAAPLGPSGQIDALVSRFHKLAAGGSRPPDDVEIRRAGLDLRRAVWDPLLPFLGEAEIVFLVPDGALHLVSFAALPEGGTGYLVETGPTIHYLSAERDLLPRAAPSGEGLLAVGGPAFDEPSLFRALAGTKKAPEPASAAPFRGRRPDCASFRSHRFGPLSGARIEAEEVAALWKDRAGAAGRDGPAARLLTGSEASEEAVKDLVSGTRVLHLATHGFFLSGDCPSALDGTRGFGSLAPAREEPPAPAAGENPLSLSGLVLAGANHRSAAGADEEDGILTAEEIAALDLAGTEWAVLSACDTGAGEIRAGEGVLGLRRAFQIAGARTLFLSLWPVDDAAARTWMAALYRARFIEGKTTADAAREAARRTLAERRRGGRSAHPFFWAAFVAAGDWR